MRSDIPILDGQDLCLAEIRPAVAKSSVSLASSIVP